MKKLVNCFKMQTMLCALCIAVTSLTVPWYRSFLFLGKPEVPECLKEE